VWRLKWHPHQERADSLVAALMFGGWGVFHTNVCSNATDDENTFLGSDSAIGNARNGFRSYQIYENGNEDNRLVYGIDWLCSNQSSNIGINEGETPEPDTDPQPSLRHRASDQAVSHSCHEDTLFQVALCSFYDNKVNVVTKPFQFENSVTCFTDE
jgi:hypothetical protein